MRLIATQQLSSPESSFDVSGGCVIDSSLSWVLNCDKGFHSSKPSDLQRQKEDGPLLDSLRIQGDEGLTGLLPLAVAFGGARRIKWKSGSLSRGEGLHDFFQQQRVQAQGYGSG